MAGAVLWLSSVPLNRPSLKANLNASFWLGAAKNEWSKKRFVYCAFRLFRL